MSIERFVQGQDEGAVRVTIPTEDEIAEEKSRQKEPEPVPEPEPEPPCPASQGGAMDGCSVGTAVNDGLGTTTVELAGHNFEGDEVCVSGTMVKVTSIADDGSVETRVARSATMVRQAVR